MRLTVGGLLLYVLFAGVFLASARLGGCVVIVDAMIARLLFAHHLHGTERRAVLVGAGMGLLLAVIGLYWLGTVYYHPDYQVLREVYIDQSLPVACQLGLLAGGSLGLVAARLVGRGTRPSERVGQGGHN